MVWQFSCTLCATELQLWLPIFRAMNLCPNRPFLLLLLLLLRSLARSFCLSPVVKGQERRRRRRRRRGTVCLLLLPLPLLPEWQSQHGTEWKKQSSAYRDRTLIACSLPSLFTARPSSALVEDRTRLPKRFVCNIPISLHITVFFGHLTDGFSRPSVSIISS